jgi:hypothetical protein
MPTFVVDEQTSSVAVGLHATSLVVAGSADNVAGLVVARMPHQMACMHQRAAIDAMH